MEDLRGLDWSLVGFETVKREGGLPDGSASEGSTCQCRRPKRNRFDTWVGRIPWRRKWQPAPVFLPGKSNGQRSLVGYSPWGRKELDMT